MKWKKGQRAKIADLAGISQQNFSDILHRKRRCSKLEKATILSAASDEILGVDEISWIDFLDSYGTLNEYFFGDPIKAR